MTGLIQFLKSISDHCRTIPHRLASGVDYLNRWYLLGKENHKLAVLCLHELLVSDPTDLHDHPACYFALILKGGYWEETPNGMFWRRPGHFRFRSARSRHRIEIDPKVGPCTTLFFMGPRTRNWGFYKDGQWIDHDTYLDNLKIKG